ncbi:MAG: GNAT family N-acetyltransferase [Eubacteriales bacterium]
MAQLKMLWFGGAPALTEIPEGFDIITHADDGKYGADLTAGWIDACEELNGKLVTREDFQKSMLDDPALTPAQIFYIVERSSGSVGGTAAALMNPDCPSLHMVGVSKAYRGRGLSAPVCAAVLRYFDENGVRRASLNTDDFRIPAIKTYLRLGYRPWLYEDDMAERWTAIYAKIGADSSEYPMLPAES